MIALFGMLLLFGCNDNHTTSLTDNRPKKEDSWINVTHGVPTNTPYTLSSVEGVLYVYAGYTFYRSSNNGDSWSQTSATIPESTWVNAIAGLDGKIFVATHGKGVFKSSDQGSTWIFTGDSGLDVETKYVHAIEVNEEYLFIGAGSYDGVLRSSNDGNTWTPCSTGLPGKNPVFFPRVKFLQKDNTRMYACPDFSGIYYSENNGLLWQAMNTGLPSDAHVYEISITDNLLYATVCSFISPGLYRCIRSELIWVKMPITVDMYSFTSPHFVAAQGSVVLFSKETGIYLSMDYGSSWNISNQQLSDSAASQLYHSVIQNNYVFVPDNYHGIWRYSLNN